MLDVEMFVVKIYGKLSIYLIEKKVTLTCFTLIFDFIT